MKNILIVALLIILVASRAHLKKEDPLETCMKKFCYNEASACGKAPKCPTTIQTCGNALQKDKNINKFNTCLKSSPEASSVMECVINNCANAKANHDAVNMLINHMN